MISYHIWEEADQSQEFAVCQLRSITFTRSDRVSIVVPILLMHIEFSQKQTKSTQAILITFCTLVEVSTFVLHLLDANQNQKLKSGS